MKIILSQPEIAAIFNALAVACDVYRDSVKNTDGRVREQFVKQEAEAAQLRERFENLL